MPDSGPAAWRWLALQVLILAVHLSLAHETNGVSCYAGNEGGILETSKSSSTLCSACLYCCSADIKQVTSKAQTFQSERYINAVLQ
jgi:hypothetical protein